LPENEQKKKNELRHEKDSENKHKNTQPGKPVPGKKRKLKDNPLQQLLHKIACNK
jgi:hypothetical protein